MLVAALLAANRDCPDRLAVDDGRLSLTYRRLTRVARVFRDLVRKQTQCDRVGIMLPAGAAFPAALFGTLWASKIVVPLNFLLNPQELDFVVRDAGLDLILTIRHFAENVKDLPARTIFLEDLPLKRRVFFAGLRRLPPEPEVDPDALAVLLYTSGTTAQPKGVELSARNLHSNAADSIASLNITQTASFLNILPPFHVFGLTGNVLIPVLIQGTVYAHPRFNPAAAVRTLKEHRIMVALAVPSMWAALLRTKSADVETFRTVKIAISGGEPLPASVRAGFLERFNLHLYEGYGLTETSPIISTCLPHADRPGTVGKPIRNVEVKIAGDHGAPLPPGADGEVLVKTPGLMRGYHHRPEETAAVITPDGWFRTGDVGHLDADGFLKLTGRSKELLIIGGENVFPGEIEAVLTAHPKVLEAAVIGVPDETRGEAPVAFVTPAEGEEVTEDELRQFARQSLAGFKVPKRVHIRADLPRGPTGKILKRRLKDLL